MDEIKEILSRYDIISKKGFDYSSVIEDLSTVSKSAKATEVFRFESIAFSFVEWCGEEKSEDYFIPQTTYKNERGEEVDVPSTKSITPDCIKYWQERYKETQNPLMKVRYAGLLFEFQEAVASERKGVELIDGYIENLLLTVEDGYPKYEVMSLTFLKRAFVLNHKCSREFAERIKRTLEGFEQDYGNDDSPGIWGRCFLLVLANKSDFTHEETQRFVDKQHNRLDRLCEKHDKIIVVNEQVDLLIQYYKRCNDKPVIQALLDKMYGYLKYEKSSLSAMIYVHWLGLLQKKYSMFGLKQGAEKLLKEITEKSPQTLTELQKSEINFQYLDSFWKKLEEFLLKGDIQTIFERFSLYFIPDKDEQSRFLQELADNNPLSYMFPKTLLDYKGRIVAAIDSIEKDFEGNLHLHYANMLTFGAYTLYRAKKILVESGVFTIDNIMAYISRTPCIEKGRLSLIRRGIEAYLTDDFVVATHLLIPQIEQAIRNVLEINGGVIIKCKDGAFQLRTFDDILRDPLLQKSLGTNICYYCINLFTSSRGLNIRNNVCHGLFSNDMFNYVVADRAFHALMVLGLIRYNNV